MGVLAREFYDALTDTWYVNSGLNILSQCGAHLDGYFHQVILNLTVAVYAGSVEVANHGIQDAI